MSCQVYVLLPLLSKDSVYFFVEFLIWVLYETLGVQAWRPVSFGVKFSFDVLVECCRERSLLVNWFDRLKVFEDFVFNFVVYFTCFIIFYLLN